MQLVEQIGSYAGFAAVVGLAVLSALYFSQARDVRRLREWIGGASEGARQAPAQQAPAQPVRGRDGHAVSEPAPAAPATAAPPPAVAGGTATPEARSEAGQVPSGRAPAPGQAAAAGPGAPAPVLPSAPQGRSPTGAGAAPADTLAGAPRPERGGLTRAGGRGRRRLGLPAPRYVALVVAGLLVVGGAAAFALTRLLEEPPRPAAAVAPDAGGAERPVDPSTVTVSVLNGTSVEGLAARVGDKVEAAGFRKGNVTNATEHERSESAALFQAGAARQARAVARRLGISQIEPMDPASRALAGDASVVVIVGADRAR